MGEKRVPPLFGDMFLRVFGSEGSEGSRRAVLALANAMLRAAGARELERADEVRAETSIPGGARLKSPRLDVVVRCDGRRVDIEAERCRVDVFNKSAFYASKLAVAGTPKGGDSGYWAAPEVAVITLYDNEAALFEGEQFLTVGRTHWEREGGCVAPRDSPLFVIVEVSKFRLRYNGLTEEVLADEALAWLYLLSKGYESDEEVREMSERFDGIMEFAREYGYALDDPALVRDYDRWLDSELEWASGMHMARQDGIAEGRAEGRAEAIAKLRELGVDELIVAQVAALSEGA